MPMNPAECAAELCRLETKDARTKFLTKERALRREEVQRTFSRLPDAAQVGGLERAVCENDIAMYVGILKLVPKRTRGKTEEAKRYHSIRYQVRSWQYNCKRGLGAFTSVPAAIDDRTQVHNRHISSSTGGSVDPQSEDSLAGSNSETHWSHVRQLPLTSVTYHPASVELFNDLQRSSTGEGTLRDRWDQILKSFQRKRFLPEETLLSERESALENGKRALFHLRQVYEMLRNEPSKERYIVGKEKKRSISSDQCILIWASHIAKSLRRKLIRLGKIPKDDKRSITYWRNKLSTDPNTATSVDAVTKHPGEGNPTLSGGGSESDPAAPATTSSKSNIERDIYESQENSSSTRLVTLTPSEDPDISSNVCGMWSEKGVTDAPLLERVEATTTSEETRREAYGAVTSNANDNDDVCVNLWSDLANVPDTNERQYQWRLILEAFEKSHGIALRQLSTPELQIRAKRVVWCYGQVQEMLRRHPERSRSSESSAQGSYTLSFVLDKGIELTVHDIVEGMRLNDSTTDILTEQEWRDVWLNHKTPENGWNADLQDRRGMDWNESLVIPEDHSTSYVQTSGSFHPVSSSTSNERDFVPHDTIHGASFPNFDKITPNMDSSYQYLPE